MCVDSKVLYWNMTKYIFYSLYFFPKIKCFIFNSISLFYLQKLKCQVSLVSTACLAIERIYLFPFSTRLSFLFFSLIFLSLSFFLLMPFGEQYQKGQAEKNQKHELKLHICLWSILESLTSCEWALIACHW